MNYPENATAKERLVWYSDYDIVGGHALVKVLNHLEECLSIELDFGS